MTKLSKKPISSDKIGHYINNLWSAFALAESKEDVRALFRDLFTHTEYKMFAKRFEIARRLLENERYSDICQNVGVSEKTIAHVSNILSDRGKGFRDASAKISRIERKVSEYRRKRQGVIERRFRPKLLGETLVPRAVKYASGKLVKAYVKVQKKRSVINDLKY